MSPSLDLDEDLPLPAPAGPPRALLIASIAVTLVLYFVPHGRVVAYPLILLSTLAHELGHGLVAVLVGADFSSFKMWPDASGVAEIHGHAGRLAQGAISAGGLVGPAICAALCFALGRTPGRARFCLAAIGLLLALSLVLVVRNAFGWAFVGLLTVSCWALALRARPLLAQSSLLFVAVQLSLSVFSRSDYLFADVARTAQGDLPSDVANMASALFLPYWFWGVTCGATSLGVLLLGIAHVWRQVPERP